MQQVSTAKIAKVGGAMAYGPVQVSQAYQGAQFALLRPAQRLAFLLEMRRMWRAENAALLCASQAAHKCNQDGHPSHFIETAAEIIRAYCLAERFG